MPAQKRKGVPKASATATAESLWVSNGVDATKMPPLECNEKVINLITATMFHGDVTGSDDGIFKFSAGNPRAMAYSLLVADAKACSILQEQSERDIKKLAQLMRLDEPEADQTAAGEDAGGAAGEDAGGAAGNDIWEQIRDNNENALRALHGPAQAAAQQATSGGRGRQRDSAAQDDCQRANDEHVSLEGMDINFDAINDDVAAKYGCFSYALRAGEEEFARKLLEVNGVADTRVYLYHEIILAKEANCGGDAQHEERLPTKALGVRAWLWLVGKSGSDNGGFTVDTGLDAIMKLNRLRASAKKADERKVRPTRKFRDTYYTDSIMSPHSLIRTHWPILLNEDAPLTTLYAKPETQRLFTTRSGSTREKMSMFDKRLCDHRQGLGRSRFHMASLFDPLKKITDFREPDATMEYAYPEQANIDHYFAGDLPDNYLNQKAFLLDQQHLQVSAITEEMENVDTEYTACVEEVNNLNYLIQEDSPQGDDMYTKDGIYKINQQPHAAASGPRNFLREASIADMQGRKREIRYRMVDLRRSMEQLNKDLEQAYRPLKSYLRTVWRRRSDNRPPWENGIAFKNMPVAVTSKCFFHIDLSSFEHISDVFQKKFFAKYWEVELREERQLRCSYKAYDPNSGHLDSQFNNRKYATLQNFDSSDDDTDDDDTGALQPDVDHDALVDQDLQEGAAPRLSRSAADKHKRQPLGTQQFVQTRDPEVTEKYFVEIDNSYTALERFRDDMAPVVNNWKSTRDKARTGDVPRFRYRPFHKVQQDMTTRYVSSEYVNASDMDRTIDTMMNFLMSPEAGLFGEPDELQRYTMTVRLDASADMGDEMHQLILQFFNVAYETAYMHRTGMVVTHCVMDSLNPRPTMRVHLLGWGDAGNGKSRILKLLKELFPPGCIETVNFESAKAALHADIKDSGSIGTKGADELPEFYKRDCKMQGLNAQQDQAKMQMSEAVCTFERNACLQTDDALNLGKTTRVKKKCQHARIYFLNSVSAERDVAGPLLDRMFAWNCMTCQPKERTAPLMEAGNMNAGKDVSADDDNPLSSYDKSFRCLLNAWALVVHVMGVLGYFAKGSFPMDLTAFYIMFMDFNNMNRRRGLPDMSNRQAHRARHFAESFAMERIVGRLFCMPHAPFQGKDKAFHIKDIFTEIRLLELRMVVRPSDAFKAIITVMSTDRADEVAHVLPAICRVVTENPSMTHSVMFGDRIERSGGKRTRHPSAKEDDIDNSRCNFDLDYIKFQVSRNEGGIDEFCEMVAAKMENVKFPASKIRSILEFMKQSETWCSMEHVPYDIAFVKSNNRMSWKTLLQCKALERDGKMDADVITNANLDVIGNLWRQRSQKGRAVDFLVNTNAIFFPFENKALAQREARELGRDANVDNCTHKTRTFNFDNIKDKGYIEVSTHLLALAFKQAGGVSAKVTEELATEICNSNTKSGYIGNPGIGMAGGLDLAAPQLLGCCYLKNNPDKDVIYPNLNHVDTRNHKWLAGDAQERADACQSLATYLEPNKPISSLRHHQRVEDVAHQDPILTTVHTLFQGDFEEAISLMGPGILHDAFDTSFMKAITGDEFDPCDPFASGERKHTEQELRVALRRVLSTPPHLGGYLDFMRHLNPWEEGKAALLQRSAAAEEEFRRILEEVTHELVTLYYAKHEGTLYSNALNMGDMNDFNKEQRWQEEEVCMDEEELAATGADTYAAMELEDRKKGIKSRKDWARNRARKNHATKQRLLKERGIDAKRYTSPRTATHLPRTTCSGRSGTTTYSTNASSAMTATAPSPLAGIPPGSGPRPNASSSYASTSTATWPTTSRYPTPSCSGTSAALSASGPPPSKTHRWQAY